MSTAIPISTEPWSLREINLLVLRHAMQGDAAGMPDLQTPYGVGHVQSRRDEDGMLVLKLPYGTGYIQPACLTEPMPTWQANDPVDIRGQEASVIRVVYVRALATWAPELACCAGRAIPPPHVATRDRATPQRHHG